MSTLVSIEIYKTKIERFNFEEFPEIIFGEMPALDDFLKFEELSIDVKIHLASMLIRRSVGITTGIYLPVDVDWLINNFLREYNTDLADASRHGIHKKAIEMVMSEKTFADCIIGTTYMYTAIEFYLKHKLGFKEFVNSVEERSEMERFKNIYIGQAYLKVKKTNFRVSREFHLIDDYIKEKSERMGFDKEELQHQLLYGRLNSKRNTSLHGHYQFFHSEGTLLTLLFILLHYCEMAELKA